MSRGARIARRTLLAALPLPLLQGCAPTLPPLRATASTAAARALLADSAAAHGAAAFGDVRDISVRYSGHFRALVGSLVPVLVDPGFRGSSEERLLLPDRLVAQSHTGPSGHKEVVRRTAAFAQGDVGVWFNGEVSSDADKRAAAALVADGYSLFLLGPLLLAGPWTADRSLLLGVADPETITVGGASQACDTLRIAMAPGLGLAERDDLLLFIGREDRLMHRVRFSLNGLDATRGAVAEVDMWAHIPLQGVRWPTRFHEQLLRPLPLPVHEWQLDGLDLNRGLTAADLSGPELIGPAAPPATPLAGIQASRV